MMKVSAQRIVGRMAVIFTALLLVRATCADVLPDDRADLFYSKYSGGGMDITGESVLVRKKFTENFAVEANYFVDKVSGASIDVLSQASQIKDERKQKSGTVEYVHDKTTYTASFINSVERDYKSDTGSFSLKQDMFGDLTTLSLAFSNTNDTVGENNGTAFVPVIDLARARGKPQLRRRPLADPHQELHCGREFQRHHRSGLPRAIPTGRCATSIRATPRAIRSASQVYPDTRTSTAIQVEGKYYLPYRAAITGSYRYFRDTWDIVGNTYELDYTHPISNIWILEGRFRYYKQNHANFYSDLFEYADEYRFEGRDQDLAAQENYTIGAKATYAFLPNGWKMFKRATVTLDVSRVTFHYLDFTNIKYYGIRATNDGGYQPGSEPLYQFNATVFQLYMSMFF